MRLLALARVCVALAIGSLVITSLMASGAGTAAAADKPAKEYPSFGEIKRLDPKLDKLIPAGAKLEKLASGFEWAEGPVWVKKGGYLLFSDIPNNAIMKWVPGDDAATTFLKPAGYTGSEARGGETGTNGLFVDSKGRLTMCQHGDRRVARWEDGKFVTLADKYEGKRLNSPNDGVFKSNGDLYFTDPPYGLEKGKDDPKRELDFCGIYRVTPEGKLTLLSKEMTFPNGITFSPDEKTLYVAQSDPAAAIWRAFEVKEDGTLGKSRVLFDSTAAVKAGKKGLPDGLKTDQQGNIFATGPGGVYVFSAAGDHLGTIDTGEATANCNWGEDGSVLYITADMYLGRVKTTTKGRGF